MDESSLVYDVGYLEKTVFKFKNDPKNHPKRVSAPQKQGKGRRVEVLVCIYHYDQTPASEEDNRTGSVLQQPPLCCVADLGRESQRLVDAHCQGSQDCIEMAEQLVFQGALLVGAASARESCSAEDDEQMDSQDVNGSMDQMAGGYRGEKASTACDVQGL